MINATEPKTNVYRKWFILANVSVGSFMSTLDASITNVGLPTISTTMHVPLHIIQWVVSAYLLTICAMLPLVGRLSDILSRGRVYNYGFLVFALGSVFCAISPNITLLITSRVIQALGASLLMANNQGLIAVTFPKEQRGRALGIAGATVSLGSLTGPALGGVLIGFFGWSSIFWVNVPIGVIGFVLGLFLLPKERPSNPQKSFDYLGAVMFIFGIVSLLYTISNGEFWGWTSKLTLFGLTASMLVLIIFGIQERTSKYPIIDFSLYRNRTLAAASLAAMLSFISLFFINTLMPFYLEDVLHTSPQTTGLTMMANPIAMAVIAPISGWLSEKIGPYILTTSGLAINAIGFVSLNLLSIAVPVWLVALHLVVFGIGQGMFQSPNNSNTMSTAPRDKVGSVGSINALIRNTGMVLGIASSVSLFSIRLHALTGERYTGVPTHLAPQPFMGALHTVFWVAAGICLTGAIVSSMRSSLKNIRNHGAIHGN